VTGANKGIGLEIARQLGKKGLRVLLGARNLALGEVAAASLRKEGLEVQAIELDLNREETIARAAATIAAEFEHLDVLVNNAGIFDMSDAPPSAAPMDAIRRTMETNFIGTVAVTQAMLPLLRKAPAARIVNLSSGLASLEWNGDPAWSFAGAKYLGYNASKAAVNMLTVQLAFELRDTPIKVNSANPGYVATDMNAHSGPGTAEDGAAEPVRLALLGADGPTGGFFETGGANPW
jgi:NAD(P)-dependent dehydrogenase (short-subunit alcohol dehydrogenase family)